MEMSNDLQTTFASRDSSPNKSKQLNRWKKVGKKSIYSLLNDIGGSKSNLIQTEIKQIWDIYDQDGNGKLDRDEVKHYI